MKTMLGWVGAACAVLGRDAATSLSLMRARHFAPDIGLAPPTLPKDYAPGPATVTHEFAQPSCVVCLERVTTTELLEIKGHGWLHLQHGVALW